MYDQQYTVWEEDKRKVEWNYVQRYVTMRCFMRCTRRQLYEGKINCSSLPFEGGTMGLTFIMSKL